MDLQHFLNLRIEFIKQLYARASDPFREIKRKIEANEEPFVDVSNAEEYDGEPPFLRAWQEADASLVVVGASALDLLQGTLHAYLDWFLKTTGLADEIPNIKGKSGWFKSYEKFFEDTFRLDWSASLADLSLIEQVVLARNDHTHNPDLPTFYSHISASHRDKYPDSPFINEFWRESFFVERTPVSIDSDVVEKSIEAVRRLCGYLEAHRGPFIQ